MLSTWVVDTAYTQFPSRGEAKLRLCPETVVALAQRYGLSPIHRSATRGMLHFAFAADA